MKAAEGTVFKYGDNVDTDVIIPARYLNSSDPKELAQLEAFEKVISENGGFTKEFFIELLVRTSWFFKLLIIVEIDLMQ